MDLCQHLFSRLKAVGVQHVFGIPGDFVLPLFRALEEEAGLTAVILTHEPSVGYAADAYARLRGLGVAAVTYGAGALNMVNAIAQAYAERSPVLVLSGAPERISRDSDLLLHHRVKTFASQLHVFCEVTGIAISLDDPVHAACEIDRVVAYMLDVKRPGYIEIPRDLMRANVPISRPPPKGDISISEHHALEEAVGEVIARLQAACSPVIYAGIEIRRFGLHEKLILLAEKYNFPAEL